MKNKILLFACFFLTAILFLAGCSLPLTQNKHEALIFEARSVIKALYKVPLAETEEEHQTLLEDVYPKEHIEFALEAFTFVPTDMYLSIDVSFENESIEYDGKTDEMIYDAVIHTTYTDMNGKQESYSTKFTGTFLKEDNKYKLFNSNSKSLDSND